MTLPHRSESTRESIAGWCDFGFDVYAGVMAELRNILDNNCRSVKEVVRDLYFDIVWPHFFLGGGRATQVPPVEAAGDLNPAPIPGFPVHSNI